MEPAAHDVCVRPSHHSTQSPLHKSRRTQCSSSLSEKRVSVANARRSRHADSSVAWLHARAVCAAWSHAGARNAIPARRVQRCACAISDSSLALLMRPRVVDTSDTAAQAILGTLVSAFKRSVQAHQLAACCDQRRTLAGPKGSIDFANLCSEVASRHGSLARCKAG